MYDKQAYNPSLNNRHQHNSNRFHAHNTHHYHSNQEVEHSIHSLIDSVGSTVDSIQDNVKKMEQASQRLEESRQKLRTIIKENWSYHTTQSNTLILQLNLLQSKATDIINATQPVSSRDSMAAKRSLDLYTTLTELLRKSKDNGEHDANEFAKLATKTINTQAKKIQYSGILNVVLKNILLCIATLGGAMIYRLKNKHWFFTLPESDNVNALTKQCENINDALKPLAK